MGPHEPAEGISSTSHPRKSLLGEAESWWTLWDPLQPHPLGTPKMKRYCLTWTMPSDGWAAVGVQGGGFGSCLAA